MKKLMSKIFKGIDPFWNWPFMNLPVLILIICLIIIGIIKLINRYYN